MFTKGIDYLDQREYRFVIFNDQEPSEPYVDLEVSSCLWNLMQDCNDALPNSLTRYVVVPNETVNCKQDDSEDMGNAPDEGTPSIASIQPEKSDLLPDLFDLLEDPTIPFRPHLNGSDPSVDTQRLTDSVLLAFRSAVGNVPDKHLMEIVNASVPCRTALAQSLRIVPRSSADCRHKRLQVQIHQGESS